MLKSAAFLILLSYTLQALTASGGDYEVDLFMTGLQGGTGNGSNYSASFVTHVYQPIADYTSSPNNSAHVGFFQVFNDFFYSGSPGGGGLGSILTKGSKFALEWLFGLVALVVFGWALYSEKGYPSRAKPPNS